MGNANMAAIRCLGIFSLLFFVNISAQYCRSGWYYHEGSCYGFGQEDVTWADAEEMCELYQATLAEIDSKAENDFLKGIIKNQTLQAHSVWLGGTDIFSEGHWEWVSRKEPIIEFTDWYPGEPNQSGSPGGEDCLQYFGLQNWQWNDEDCDSKSYFICETES